MRARGQTAGIICVIVLLRASGANAQTGEWDVSAGYVRVADSLDLVSMHGWTAGVGIRVSPWLAIAAESDLATHTEGDLQVRTWTLLGGPRASVRVGPFTEFAQLAAGPARFSSTVFGEHTAETRGALQPGGGIDIGVGRRFSARIQIDWRWITGGDFDSEDRHQIRAAASLVYTTR
ncbi:MAG TPA: hypothetical protein VIW45_03280 [Vicinamibacterales bacterium]|jgi:hypothetical protein